MKLEGANFGGAGGGESVGLPSSPFFVSSTSPAPLPATEILQLILANSLPGSGTPKKCLWQSKVSKSGLSPAVMYHRPSKSARLNSASCASGGGIG